MKTKTTPTIRRKQLLVRQVENVSDLEEIYELFQQGFCSWDLDHLHLVFRMCFDSMFVAVVNSKIVGTCSLSYFDNDVAKLGTCFVHPRFRGIGVGNMLRKRAIDAAKRKVKEIMVTSIAANTRLYYKQGFDNYVYGYSVYKGVPCWPESLTTAAVVDDKIQIKEIKEDDMENLVNLDEDIHAWNREELLDYYVNHSAYRGFVAIESNHAVGYCFVTIIDNHTLSFRMLYSNEDHVALRLVYYIHKLCQNDHKLSIILRAVDENTRASGLCELLQLNKVASFVTLSTGGDFGIYDIIDTIYCPGHPTLVIV